MKRALVVMAIAACGTGPAPVPPAPPIAKRAPRLAAPSAGDPTVRGARYLRALGEVIQPRWATFLEDCRVRLSPAHPLNASALVATVELAIAADGKVVARRPVAPSGNGEFDTAVSDVLADATPLPPPPRDLASDDELVHVRWQFARDRRQAGPATAAIATVALPVATVVTRLLERGDVAGAARRADATLTEVVMIAALREALASPSGTVRLAAVEAIGRARVHALAAEVRALLPVTIAEDLRVAAAVTIGQLGDRTAVPELVATLDVRRQPRVALAELGALVALGAGEQASTAVAAALPDPTALAALAVVAVPDAQARLAGWFAQGDGRTRAAVCAGKPDQALVRRGLADADATVRALCVDAATVMSARLLELAADRDQLVRARAVAAIARLDPRHAVHATRDAAAMVRAAAVPIATPVELAALAEDRDADVRAAAVARVGAPAAAKAASDAAPQVRLAAVDLADAATLERLARDNSPAVATAAIIAVVRGEGRTAATPRLLEQLASSPSGEQRVRIALAWLLAS